MQHVNIRYLKTGKLKMLFGLSIYCYIRNSQIALAGAQLLLAMLKCFFF